MWSGGGVGEEQLVSDAQRKDHRRYACAPEGATGDTSRSAAPARKGAGQLKDPNAAGIPSYLHSLHGLAALGRTHGALDHARDELAWRQPGALVSSQLPR